MIGIAGLLNLAALVQALRMARAAGDEEGGAACPRPPSSMFPPPTTGTERSRWERLPHATRQRLLWLLSQLLERQLQLPQDAPRTEASDDAALRPR
jgi:hypothetical protein